MIRTAIIAAGLALASTPVMADFIRHSDGDKTYIYEVKGKARLGPKVERFETLDEAMNGVESAHFDGSEGPLSRREIVAKIKRQGRVKTAATGIAKPTLAALAKRIDELEAAVAGLQGNSGNNGNSGNGNNGNSNSGNSGNGNNGQGRGNQ